MRADERKNFGHSSRGQFDDGSGPGGCFQISAPPNRYIHDHPVAFTPDSVRQRERVHRIVRTHDQNFVGDIGSGPVGRRLTTRCVRVSGHDAKQLRLHALRRAEPSQHRHRNQGRTLQKRTPIDAMATS